MKKYIEMYLFLILAAFMFFGGPIYAQENNPSSEPDIQKQTVGSMKRELKIEESFKDARRVLQDMEDKFKTTKNESIQSPKTQDISDVDASANTPVSLVAMRETIRGLLKPEDRDKKIDLDFDVTEINNIFMTMANLCHINVILDPVIKNNKTDLHLKLVTAEEAFILMANTYNLGFKRVGDSLYVTTKDKLREQDLVSKVFKLRNIKVMEVKSLLEGLGANVTISEEINSLVVTGVPDELAKVEGILAKVDRVQPQVILEANVIEVNKDALKDLGIDWSDQINLAYQESGRPATFANTETHYPSAIKILSIARNPVQFTTIIKMLENQNKAKVLSNPRVTTLNNKEAEIFVGDRIPYTVTTVSGGVATTDVRFEEPGIRLKITPSIIEDNFVVIKVEPEVSFIFAYRGPNDDYPHTKKRSATTYVRVKNNQPFVIGGLLNQEDKQNLFRVPFLGSVPLLGNLFKYEKHTITDTELIIMIIQTVVYGDS